MKNIIIRYCFHFAVLLLFLSVCDISTFAKVNDAKEFNSLTDKVEYYKDRYGVKCLDEKITNNHGDGFDALYGTRNMRTILYGIAYRGGANNYYHKLNKRDNHNPLPEDGLEHLLSEGFSDVYYLYATNYKDAKKLWVSKDKSDTLHYLNNSGNARKDMRNIMQDVLDVINNPAKGPIYLHCWNGWHQSGYVSAAILMQFCKFSNESAYQYWLQNTDGVNKGYEGVKNQVKTFKPFPDISIPDSIRQQICPCMKQK
ncbi:MAG: hypothetical protein A2X64_10175 [Ignavibacteria bacterium GWF2_33_9]|nr:MAG: hypothetical protein A2X64_10175 [Ignavibacteria bacterium GWF2_33_9]